MKISDEAIESACRIIFGFGWGTHDTPSDRNRYDRNRRYVREGIQAALSVDGYPKLLGEALDVMHQTGWPNAIDHATSVDGIIELAAYETYEALKTKMGA